LATGFVILQPAGLPHVLVVVVIRAACNKDPHLSLTQYSVRWFFVVYSNRNDDTA